MAAALLGLAVDLTRIAQRDNILPTVFALTAWFIARRATASFSRLFDTQSSGRIGSPMVAGSTRLAQILQHRWVGRARKRPAGALTPHPNRRRRRPPEGPSPRG